MVGEITDERGLPMKFVDAARFTAERAWGATDLSAIGDATVRLHWTNEPYVWHVNDGPEVFVVLDGTVDMHYSTGDEERVQTLTPGRICVAEIGDEHVARPRPEARILVVEQRGSI